MSTEEVKRGRGRPRKIVYGNPDVAPSPPRLVVPTAPLAELRLSKVHRAVIQSLAREVKTSPAVVLEDVINQGVPQVREMYADLIQCRRRVEERNNEGRSIERPLPKAVDLGAEGNGRAPEEFDSSLGPEHHALDLGRGLEGAGETAVEAYSSDDNVLTEVE